MSRALPILGAILLATLATCAASQNPSPEKTQDQAAPTAAKPDSADAKKNPVKPTPENLAEAKKIFGYDCAMCHGAQGDGKGDLVGSMGLKMKDWSEPDALTGMSDAELFEIISKGKGKMVGEGDRVSNERVWGLVNYVRALAKKTGAKPAENPPAS